MNLSELRPHQKAAITGYASPVSGEEQAVIRSMMEMGITIGAVVEVVHEGPIGHDPIAISCRGALIGVGRREAQLILVQENPA